MFQGHIQNIQVPFPYKGINTNANNDVTYARFIQNLLAADNKTGQLRFGTNLVSNFAFDANRFFRDIISVMSFLKEDGTAEKLVYVQYLTRLLYLDIVNHVVVTESVANPAFSTITIDISSYNASQKAYFQKVIFEEVRLLIRQTSNNETDIQDYRLNGNTITFTLPFKKDSFELTGLQNNFLFFIERAGIYRLKADDTFELVIDDLDPSVIVSHVNLKGKLLIANGVDPVKVYDGTSAVDLTGPVSIATTGGITVNNLTLTFNIAAVILSEIQDNIKAGSGLVLINDLETKNVTVNTIIFAAPANGLIAVTITVNIAPQASVKKIIYRKPCPAFSFLTVAHRRLWALPEGRPYQNKFRHPDLAMRVYYADKQDSVEGWFNEKSKQIAFVDMSATSDTPDNLEVITQFEGKMLFLGRETTQLWTGEDPTTIDDGQGITFPDFRWERSFPVGVLQKTLFAEIPNNLIFLSKFGIVSMTSVNLYQQINVSYEFSVPIDHHLNNQLAFIETDRDYRSMQAFLYPYGRFVGFKIKYSCFIYQLRNEGVWTVFSENFAEANSFLYDVTGKDLFLGLPDGQLLVYADKINTQSFEEYGKGKISWLISYNWIYPGDTWFNSYIYISSKTLKPLTVNIRIFLNQDESISTTDQIILQQRGVLYDVSQYNEKLYPYNDTVFSHELIKFNCDSLMMVLSGLTNELFVFDKLFLAGGNQTLRRGGSY